MKTKCVRWLGGVLAVAGLAWVAGCGNNQEDISRPAAAKKVAETNSALEVGSILKDDNWRAKPQVVPGEILHVSKWENERIVIQFNKEILSCNLCENIEITPKVDLISCENYSQTLHLKYDVKPDTEYTIVFNDGLRFADGTKLAKRQQFVVKNGPAPRQVRFADRGRYLPNFGRRVVQLEVVNETNLETRVYSVPPHNLVQLLAREEDAYRRYWGGGGDSQDAAELAGELIVRKPDLRGLKRNEPLPLQVSLDSGTGRATNGIYLIEAVMPDTENWRDVTAAHKLVCVTDLGISARLAKDNRLFVWMTSLGTGAPRGGVSVRAYGKNNALLGEAETDPTGYCEVPVAGRAAPFALIAEDARTADIAFMALTRPNPKTENTAREYAADGEVEAFVWTDRGIYRHNEKIMVQAILRNGRGQAPKPFPATLALIDPQGREYAKTTRLADANGTFTHDEFAVPDFKPSGKWRILVRMPGKDGKVIGERVVAVEEFVPPQIRATVEIGAESTSTNYNFKVGAQYLFGGPAKRLPVQCAVMLADAPFAPPGRENFRFGDSRRRIRPNFEKVPRAKLDDDGSAAFEGAADWDQQPAAAVELTVQAAVFDNAGRACTARAKSTLHHYAAYIGATLPEEMRSQNATRAVKVAMVAPDGAPFRGKRALKCSLERIDWVYSLKRKNANSWEWESEQVAAPLQFAETLELDENGEGTIDVRLGETGQYRLAIWDEATGATFAQTYRVSGEEYGRGIAKSLDNPVKVQIVPDKSVYAPGETPRLTLLAPFAGHAWIQAHGRHGLLYSKVMQLTNATSEVVLEPVTAEWTPSFEISATIVQPVAAKRQFAANRAYGSAAAAVREKERELPLRIAAAATPRPTGGTALRARIECPAAPDGAALTLTVVDEAINSLTAECTPNPVGWFGAIRRTALQSFDFFNYLLPVCEDELKRGDAKTGGDAETGLFGRVSMVPSRRFRPLSQWKSTLAFSGGVAEAEFELPEFGGEVRVTAVAAAPAATGAASERVKIAPALIIQPDAPRFIAPDDEFFCSLVMHNRSGKDGSVKWRVEAGGAVALAGAASGEVALKSGDSLTIPIAARGGGTIGEGEIAFTAEGLGETHSETILLPVRSAVAWENTGFARLLAPGAELTIPNCSPKHPQFTRRAVYASCSGMAELAAALEYLVEYPHGCLEQTVSQVFPLVAAGGALNALPVRNGKTAPDTAAIIRAGQRRVASMLRSDESFSMWPDCDYEPWDANVSVWAAFFLHQVSALEAIADDHSRRAARDILARFARRGNLPLSVYANYALAAGGAAERERLTHWFNELTNSPEKFSVIDRCRLAAAYASIGERTRAAAIAAPIAPETTLELAWAVIALAKIDGADARLDDYAQRLLRRRGAKCGHWLTTGDNALCLMALGEYFRLREAKAGAVQLAVKNGGALTQLGEGESFTLEGGGELCVVNTGNAAAFASVRQAALPEPQTETGAGFGISVKRRLLDDSGAELDPAALKRGDLVVVELELGGIDGRWYSDLVISDLLPACFEPELAYAAEADGPAWEMRRDVRDDRVLVYSKRFALETAQPPRCRYAVRVVSRGKFAWPGTRVEAMYEPQVNARLPDRAIEIGE